MLYLTFLVDLLLALKREKPGEDAYSDHTKKPKKADKRYRRKDRRVATSMDASNSMNISAIQSQPFNGFFTHRPSTSDFDFVSTAYHPPLSSVSPQPMLMQYQDLRSTIDHLKDGPEQVEIGLTNGKAVSVNSTLPFGLESSNSSPLSSYFQPSPPPVPKETARFKRHSLPMAQLSFQNQFTSRPSSPAFEFPPVPPMPSEDVTMPTRQRILEETIEVNKEFLKKWEQESHQHIKSIFLNNILERNKSVSIFHCSPCSSLPHNTMINP